MCLVFVLLQLVIVYKQSIERIMRNWVQQISSYFAIVFIEISRGGNLAII
jgi:hypothetical protein